MTTKDTNANQSSERSEDWFAVLIEDVDPAFARTWHPGTAAFPVTCPLCGGVHHGCRFASGTLHCVRVGCRNPHHRPRIEEIPF